MVYMLQVYQQSTVTPVARQSGGSGRRTTMIKLLITATSFALGGAGVVLIGYLSATPLAFTHPMGGLPAVAAIRPVAAEPAAVEPPDNAIVLAEVRIAGTRG